MLEPDGRRGAERPPGPVRPGALSAPLEEILGDDHADGGSTLALVLELLHGTTLARSLELGPLPFREALRIGIEVAKGLAAPPPGVA